MDVCVRQRDTELMNFGIICLAFALFQPLLVLNLILSWINFSFSIYKRIYLLKMRNENKTRKVLSRICLWILRDMFILGK